MSPFLSTVVVNPDTVAADGVAHATITVTVRDGQGQTMAAQVVNPYVSGTANTLTPPSGNTDSNGVFTATLSSTAGEVKLLSVEVNPFPHNVRIANDLPISFVTPPDSAHCTIMAAPVQGHAGAEVSIALTAHIADALGRPLSGANVIFRSTGPGAFVPPQALTAMDGTVSVDMASPTVGMETVTMEVDGVLLNTSVQVEFLATPLCAPLHPLTYPVPSLVGSGYELELLTTTMAHHQGTLRGFVSYSDWPPMAADMAVCSGGFLDPAITISVANHNIHWSGPTPANGEFSGIHAIPANSVVAAAITAHTAQDGPASVWGYPVNRVVYADGTWLWWYSWQGDLLLVTHICF